MFASAVGQTRCEPLTITIDGWELVWSQWWHRLSNSGGAGLPEPISQSTDRLTRTLCGLVMALMALSVAYALWIVVQNWSHIGV